MRDPRPGVAGGKAPAGGARRVARARRGPLEAGRLPEGPGAGVLRGRGAAASGPARKPRL